MNYRQRTSHNDVRNTAVFSWLCSGHRKLMSRIQPAFPGHIPDIVVRCPEQGQYFLAILRTSLCDVRNRASFSWSYSGHRSAMSRIWPGKPGCNPDINVRCPEHGQFFLFVFRTSLFNILTGDFNLIYIL